MSRTTVDIDDDLLKAAARELGTATKVETINNALAFVAERRKRIEAFDNPLIWGGPDLANPEIRAEGRR